MSRLNDISFHNEKSHKKEISFLSKENAFSIKSMKSQSTKQQKFAAPPDFLIKRWLKEETILDPSKTVINEKLIIREKNNLFGKSKIFRDNSLENINRRAIDKINTASTYETRPKSVQSQNEKSQSYLVKSTTIDSIIPLRNLTIKSNY